MTYPPQQNAWPDPDGGPSYVDPVTGQPAYPMSGPGYVDQFSGQPYPSSPAGYPAQPQGYPAQPAGYPAQPPGYLPSYPGYAPVLVPAQSTNGMAIASLVLSLCGLLTCGASSLVGAILGHVSRRQIRERGEAGDGMALAGIITGWIIFVLGMLGVAAYIALIVFAVKSASDLPTDYPTY